MLFTDGYPADGEVLRAYESAVLDVTGNEAIDLDAKMEIAAEQVGDEVSALLNRQSGAAGGVDCLQTVVVTPGLRRWHAMQTLEMVYRDAYYQELNDRYKAKWRMYSELRREARDQCFANGVGVVFRPVPAGPVPTLSTALGEAPAGDAYVRVTWTDGAGDEGAGGEVRTMTLPGGSTLAVSVGTPPREGLQWNLYAGTVPEFLTLQNDIPLAAGDVWMQAGALRTDGRPLASGQWPDYYIVDNRDSRRINRG